MADFIEDIRKLQREINQSFSNVFRGTRERWREGGFGEEGLKTPLIDLVEDEKEIIAILELPGVEKKDIHLNVFETHLEVKVIRKKEAKIEKEGMIRSERNYLGFYRAMALPEEIIPEKAEAKYENGILRITLPKAKKIKKGLIEIK
ncbi:MAG: Hsp20/alpha crystallin family protein [Nanoarchaeota archaeon]